MHPATMEWLIIQAAVNCLEQPLAEKSIELKRLADELAPEFHQSIISLHLKKMKDRGLLDFRPDNLTKLTEQVTFLAKIDYLMDIAPKG